jgi:hypothetical protein
MGGGCVEGLLKLAHHFKIMSLNNFSDVPILI